jgi:hypothetical protein
LEQSDAQRGKLKAENKQLQLQHENCTQSKTTRIFEIKEADNTSSMGKERGRRREESKQEEEGSSKGNEEDK